MEVEVYLQPRRYMGMGGQRHAWAGTSLTTGRHFPDDDVILGDSLCLLDLHTLLADSIACAVALRSN